MKRESFISFILENILPKAVYNEEIDGYELRYKDYEEYNLSVSQKKILKEICKKNGIFLECVGYIRQPLVAVEDSVLFKEYNDIKMMLLTDIADEEKRKLEQRRIEIRNKIVTDNISFVNSIIEHRMTDINNMKNKEDIYQLGYEILIKYIDGNYLIKGRFKDHISSILIFSIINRLIVINERFDSKTEDCLRIIRSNIDKNLLVNELSKTMGLDKEKVYDMIKLNNFLLASDIDMEIEKLDGNEDNSNSSLYDDSFEDIILDNISLESVILGVISTLSIEEEAILKLYYGFLDREYSMVEIANMYGVTKSRISASIIDALEKIRKSIRIKYLYELYGMKNVVNSDDNFQNRRLEEFLVRNINEELFNLVIKELNYKYKLFFKIYYQNKELLINDIAKVLNMRLSSASNFKIRVINEVRNIIISNIENKYKKKITYDEYLDYLMQLYLKEYNVRRRSR